MAITYSDIKEALENYDKNKGMGRKLFADQEDITKLRPLIKDGSNQRLSAEDFSKLIKIIKDNKTEAGRASANVIQALRNKIEGYDVFSLGTFASIPVNLLVRYQYYEPSALVRDRIVFHKYPIAVINIFNTLQSMGCMSNTVEGLILGHRNEDFVKKLNKMMSKPGCNSLLLLLTQESGLEFLKMLHDAQILKKNNINNIFARKVSLNSHFLTDLKLLLQDRLLSQKYLEFIVLHYSRNQPEISVVSQLKSFKLLNQYNLDLLFAHELSNDEMSRLPLVIAECERLQLSIDFRDVIFFAKSWNSESLRQNAITFINSWGGEIHRRNLRDGYKIFVPFNENPWFLQRILQQPFSMDRWNQLVQLRVVSNYDRANDRVTLENTRTLNFLLSTFTVGFRDQIRVDDILNIGLAFQSHVGHAIFARIPPHLTNINTWNRIVDIFRNNPRDYINIVNEYVGNLINIPRAPQGNQQPPQPNERQAVNYSQSIHNKFVEKSAAESAIRLYKRYEKEFKAKHKIYRSEILAWANTLGKTEEERAAKTAIERITNPRYAYINDQSNISTDQLIILTWIAIHDEKMRGLGMNPDEEYRKKMFTLDGAKQALVNAYYQIQRGYNLDDQGNELMIRTDDKPICTGGTFIKILEKLVGLHPDVDIKFMTFTSAGEQLPGIVIAVANNYLLSLPKEEFSELMKVLTSEEISGSVVPMWNTIKEKVKEEMKDYAELFEEKTRAAKFDEFIETGQYAGFTDDALKKIEDEYKKKSEKKPENLLPREEPVKQDQNELEQMRAARLRIFEKGKRGNNESVAGKKYSPPRRT